MTQDTSKEEWGGGERAGEKMYAKISIVQLREMGNNKNSNMSEPHKFLCCERR